MPSLNFKGKALVQNFHLLVPYHELKPVKAKSLTRKPSLHDNLVVHGDNLKALKSLLPYYGGKVKCIYIDPPYNTGNVKKEGWRYNDNVDSPMHREWFGKIVSREDLTRHDKWLCMIWPRLRVLRDFLTEDGVLVVSIDDNEAHHLRSVLDEIFGEDNFVAQLVWEKGRKNDAKLFSTGHEYMLVYARSMARLRELKTVWRQTRPGAKELWDHYLDLRKIHGDDHAAVQASLRQWFKALPDSHPSKALSRFKNVDKFGPWRDRDISWPGEGGDSFYPVIHPKTKKPCKIPDTGWRYSTPEKMEEVIKLGLVEFRDDETQPPFCKSHLRPIPEELDDEDDLAEADEESVEPEELGLQVMGSVIYKQSQVTVKAFRQIMGKVKFNNPKDPEVLARVVNYVTAGDTKAVVLDAFGGSGTTGQAVLALNEADKGERRFILIEEEADYIDDLTCQRLRRVIKGVPKAKEEPLRRGLGGTFTFVHVGDPMHMQSLLKGSKLPTLEDLASYVFYTATGEDFDSCSINKKTGFIGTSARYDVYLFYKPELEYLKNSALTLDMARELPKGTGRRRLVFAPTKYLDAIHLEEHRIDFCQLPYEIYKAIKPNKA
ncbi:MAG: site-specific DNA-methyltransferase [Verrucomicrobia bacterium]|nr:MAG: site-specific DNA-methyltransferase [Verrucomicrobiota bacterium]